MAAFEVKQEYTFAIQGKTPKDATDALQRFHEDEDKIIYGPQSRIRVSRSCEFSCKRIDIGKP